MVMYGNVGQMTLCALCYHMSLVCDTVRCTARMVHPVHAHTVRYVTLLGLKTVSQIHTGADPAEA